MDNREFGPNRMDCMSGMLPACSSVAVVPSTACRAASSRAHVPTLIDCISRTAMLCITHVAHFRQYEASRCQVSLHFEPSSAQWCCRSERHRCAGAAASELQADGSRVTAARQRPKVYSLVTRGGGENAPFPFSKGGLLVYFAQKNGAAPRCDSRQKPEDLSARARPISLYLIIPSLQSRS